MPFLSHRNSRRLAAAAPGSAARSSKRSEVLKLAADETVSVGSMLTLREVLVRSDVDLDLKPLHLLVFAFGLPLALELDACCGCRSSSTLSALVSAFWPRVANARDCSRASATSSVEGLKLTRCGEVVLDGRRAEASDERLGRSLLDGASCCVAGESCSVGVVVVAAIGASVIGEGCVPETGFGSLRFAAVVSTAGPAS